MRIINYIFPLICSVLLVGCGTNIKLTVDSIRDYQRDLLEKEYVMVSGVPEIKTDDLYFREFSDYFKEALETKGYILVDNRDEADLEISLSYGISEGKNVYYTYDRPIYDFIGGNTYFFTTTRRTEEGKTVKTTERVYIPSRHALVGYTTETARKTIHTSFAILEARRPSEEGEGMMIWKTTVRHTSEISDLRYLMPFMAAAAQPYLGENTRTAKTVELEPSDPIVEEMLLLKEN